MKTLTIKDLQELCEKYVKGGYGNKKILLSDDDEGNGYHELYFGFTVLKGDTKDMVLDVCDYNITEDNINDYIVLG